MNVPRPSAGHWQMLALRQQIERRLTAERAGHVPEEVLLLPATSRQAKTAVANAGGAAVVTAENNNSDVPSAAESQRPEKQPGAPALGGAVLESDLPQAADRAVLDVLRQAGEHWIFWRESISRTVDGGYLATWLGLSEESKISEAKLAGAVKNVREDYRSFQIAWLKTARTRTTTNKAHTQNQNRITRGI